MHSKVAFKCAMLKFVNTICEIRDVRAFVYKSFLAPF